IPAFHLLNALESCGGLFTRFGGHAHAAGFSMPADRVSELRSHLDSYARTRLCLNDFEPVLNFDTELPLHEVTPEFFQLLQRLEPFGVGNPQPVFAAHGVRVAAPPQVIKEKHVRLRLKAAESVLSPDTSGTASNGTWRNSISFPALAWRMAERV